MPLSQNQIRVLSDAYRGYHSAQVDVLLRRLAAEGTVDPRLTDTLKGFLSRPGKRMRPLLFLSAYHLFYRKDGVDERVLPVAFALECFHSFILIHDDVIDRSLTRRGQPTLHRAFESEMGIHRRTAESLAIVLGDLLFGYAVESFNRCAMERELVERGLEYFLKVTEDTGLGEAQELVLLEKRLSEVNEADIERVYHLKTTRYTIEAPLVLGAWLAGAGNEVREKLASYAKPVGRAFQIENDLHEIDLDPEQLSALAYDLQTGVKTLFMKRLYDTLDEDAKQAVEEVVAPDGEVVSKDLASIRVLIGETGVREQMDLAVRDDFARARAIFEEERWGECREGLLLIADWIEAQRHHSESNLRDTVPEVV